MIWTAMILLAAQTAGAPRTPQQNLTPQQTQALSQYNFKGATAALQLQSSPGGLGQNKLAPIHPSRCRPSSAVSHRHHQLRVFLPDGRLPIRIGIQPLQAPWSRPNGSTTALRYRRLGRMVASCTSSVRARLLWCARRSGYARWNFKLENTSKANRRSATRDDGK